MPGRFALKLWLKASTGERRFDSAPSCQPDTFSPICPVFQRRPRQVLLLPSSGASNQIQVRTRRLRLLCAVVVCGERACACFRHAGLSAAQQQLIRETLMKWLQSQVANSLWILAHLRMKSVGSWPGESCCCCC